MSQNFVEGRLTFRFPAAWHICRPENASFYVRHFQNFAGGCREMDFVAFDPQTQVMWLIEVKDYVHGSRTKQEDLADEVALKSKDVLAMLPVGRIRDNGISSSGKMQVGHFWNLASSATDIRVVLHCELPDSPSKLFPGVKDVSNLQAKLTQKLRCVDPHALFTNIGRGISLPWTVA